MAFRYFNDQQFSDVANVSLIEAVRNDYLLFTRNAVYVANGANAHVVNLRAGATVAVDGQLYSSSGATIFGTPTTGFNDISVGTSGLVRSYAGTAVQVAGQYLALDNAGEITGVTSGVNTTAQTTALSNDGRISASNTGVGINSRSASVTNHGTIAADAYGLFLDEGTTGQIIDNSGYIRGTSSAGIFVRAVGDSQIVNSGTIAGRVGVDQRTYAATDTGIHSFINHGTVNGSLWAYSGSSAGDSVINDGALTGRVMLFGGNDTFDGRGGTSDRVDGGDGDDRLTGSDLGRDVLLGGAGSDILTGGAGNDLLAPGAGSDVVDGGDGRDIVSFADSASGITLSLAQNYVGDPDVRLVSIEGIEGSKFGDFLLGDDADNWLYGRDGSDTLVGGAGDDVMVGGLGNDTYRVDSTDFPQGGDRVVEGIDAGIDTVISEADTYRLGANVENLTLSGSTARYGTGNDLANTILGTSTFNGLSGGDGNDTLTGNGGADYFVLDAGGRATITDFGTDDSFRLYRSDGFFALSSGTLTTSAFWLGSAAHDADDRLIFNTANDTLYYDADGTGAGTQIAIAVLGTEVTPTADMFTVY